MKKFPKLIFFVYFLFFASSFLEGRIIVFDKGGVLTKRDFSYAASFIRETFDLSPHELDAALKRKKQEKGTSALFWYRFASERGRTLSMQWMRMLEGLYQLGRIPSVDVLAIVEELASKNYRLGMLSNTTEEVADFNRVIGYYRYFSPCLLSYEMGVDKPNPRAFELLITAVNLPPQEIIFIDDDATNIKVAKEYGIDAIHFTTAADLRRQLVERGIEIREKM